MLTHRHDIVFAAGAGETMSADPTDPGKDLPGDQKRQKIGESIRKEPVFDLYQIVLMAAEGMASKMVDAVVMKADRFVQLQIDQKLRQQDTSGPVMPDQIQQIAALRRGILLMASDRIDIEPPAVPKKPPG